MVRDIIDIDSSYEDIETEEGEKESKKNKSSEKLNQKTSPEGGEKQTEEENINEDEFNVSLAKMEEKR